MASFATCSVSILGYFLILLALLPNCDAFQCQEFLAGVELGEAPFPVEGFYCIDGNLTTLNSSIIQWRATLFDTDQLRLSFINVSESVSILCDIEVQISSEQIVQVFGEIDPSSPPKTYKQVVLEANDGIEPIRMKTKSAGSCRKLSSYSEPTNDSPDSRPTLTVFLVLDDSGCKKSSSNALKIALPVSLGAAVVLVALLVFLSYKFKPFRKQVRPSSINPLNDK